MGYTKKTVRKRFLRLNLLNRKSVNRKDGIKRLSIPGSIKKRFKIAKHTVKVRRLNRQHRMLHKNTSNLKRKHPRQNLSARAIKFITNRCKIKTCYNSPVKCLSNLKKRVSI